MNNFWRSSEQHDDDSYPCCIIDLKFVREFILNVLTKKRGGLCEVMNVLTNFIVVVTSQYIHIQNHVYTVIF